MKKHELVIAPGALDSFDGTQEELNELIAELHRLVDSGEIFEEARPLSEEEEADFLEMMNQRNVRN